ncbi:MAG TPA: glycoside hydrolase family 16 protein [Polyangiaceae bacterium]|nr:glycoside hydrolase family 16 protein [Polyangiaceae bacterium]
MRVSLCAPALLFLACSGAPRPGEGEIAHGGGGLGGSSFALGGSATSLGGSSFAMGGSSSAALGGSSFAMGGSATSLGGSGAGGVPANAGGAGATGGNGGTSAQGFGGNAKGGSAGGAGAAGTGGTGGTATAGGFTLLYRDDFDNLNRARWQLMTHSWDTNLALFSERSVTVEAGQLVLRLLPAPTGTSDSSGPKSFYGAEVRSTDAVKYGRVRTRAKLARGSAVVSALVTIYTPWPADNWNELDIECLGAEPQRVQFNVMTYTGPAVTKPVTQSVTPTQDPLKVDLGFDASQDFHVYTMEWTPASVQFLVDERVRRTWSGDLARLGLAQNVLLTIWASSTTDWAGSVDSGTGQAVAAYDWVELYRYDGP